MAEPRGWQTRDTQERLGRGVHTALGFSRQGLCPPSLCDPVQGTCALPEQPLHAVNVGWAPPAPTS